MKTIVSSLAASNNRLAVFLNERGISPKSVNLMNHASIANPAPDISFRPAFRPVRWLRRMSVALLLVAAMNGHAQMGTNGWNFKMTNFVIGAWAGPSISEAEIMAYAQAKFNTVMVGRYMDCEGAVEGWYTDPNNVKLGLDLAQKYGLGGFIDCYTQNAHPWGGLPVSSGGGQHAFNLEEFEWVHAQFGQHPALVGYLLGDDQGYVDARMASIAAFMRVNSPQLFPWISGFCTGPTLYQNGVPSSSQEIYPTLGGLQWGSDWNVSSYCQSYWGVSRSVQSYGLPFWPMPNICSSDSLNRFPAYASVAYGAKGVLYFCYAFGCFQQNGPFWTDAAVQAAQTPFYVVGQKMNGRIAAWSSWVMDRNSPGLFGTIPTNQYYAALPDGMAAPATNKLLQSASDRLVVGILTKPGATPLAMVVNGLCSVNFGDLPLRTVSLQFNPQVTGINVLEGGTSTHTNGNSITLTLEPGSGQLLQLEGTALDQLSSTAAIYGVGLPGIAWNPGGSPAGPQDGGGTWDAVSTNWWAGGSNTVWNNSLYLTASTAIIGAGNGAAGTITVGTNTVNSLIFNLASSGTYMLSGGQLNMLSGPAIVANADATITSTLAAGQAVPLVKSGTGTLTLSGTNSFPGGITVNGGALCLTVTPSISLPVTVNPGATLRLNGGLTISTPTLALNSATLSTGGGSSTINSALTVSNSAAILCTTASTLLHLNGGWTAPAGSQLWITNSGGGFCGVYIDNAAGSFTGAVAVVSLGLGQLGLNQAAAQGAFSSTDLFLTNTAIQLGNGTAGNNMLLKSLNGDSTSSVGSDNRSTTLTLGVNNGSGDFSGTINNGAGSGPLVSLVKTGSGRQTLRGASGYTGITSINQGTLALAGSGSLGGSSSISVAAGATLDVSGRSATFALGAGQTLAGGGVITGAVATVSGAVLAPGATGAPATLNFSNNLSLVNATLSFDFSTNTVTGNGVNDLIQMAGGTLTMSGNNKVMVKFHDGLPLGTYTLLRGAGFISGGAANLSLTNSLRPGLTATFDTTSVPGSVRLTIAGSASSLVWSGNNGTNWNYVTTNWNNGGVGDLFWDGDAVTLDDTAATGTVNVAATVAPSSVLVSNSALNYTISGSPITSGWLRKAGSGTLVLGSANSYQGATVLSQGTLRINQSSAAGTGAITLGDGGTGAANVVLALNTSLANPITVTASGTGLATLRSLAQYQTASSPVTLNRSTIFSIPGSTNDWWFGFSGNISGNVGTLTIDADSNPGGNYRVYWTGTNTFAGSLVVNPNGRLQVGFGAAIPDSSDVTVNGGLQVSVSEAMNGLNGNGSIWTGNGAQVLTLGAANGGGSFSGSLADVALTKVGNGTQTLAGTGIVCPGLTIVAGGTLRLVDATAFTSTITTISAGATLELNASGTWNYGQLLTGAGQVVKSGPGSLTLLGAGYTGATVINGGTLNLTDLFGPTASVIINSGGTLDISGRLGATVTVNDGGTLAVAAGVPFTVPSVNFATGATTLNVTGDVTGIPGMVVVTNTGGLLNSGSVTVNVGGRLPPQIGGAFTVITYTGIRGGAGSFVAGSLPNGMAGYIRDTGAAIQLVITNLGPNTLWWSGAPNNTWDIGNTVAWYAGSGGGATAFFNGVTVGFDDSASNFTVNVGAAVAPSIVTMNATNNYTVQGTPIQATGIMLKSGSGWLTVLDDIGAAGFDLWGGVLQIGNGGTNGSLATAGGLLTASNSMIAFLRADDVSFTNSIAGGGGVLKLGTNTLTLGGSNAYTGPTLLNAGMIAAGSSSNLPSGSMLVMSNGTAVSFTGTMTFASDVALGSGQSAVLKASGAAIVTLAGNYTNMAGVLVLDMSSCSNYAGFIPGSASGPAGPVSVLAHSGQWSQLSPNNAAYQGFFANSKLTLPASGNVYVQGGNSSANNLQFGALDGGNASTIVGFDNRAGCAVTIVGIADGNFAGVIFNGSAAGANNLVKLGSSTQTLSGANTYTGTTTVGGGTLAIGSAANLPSGSALTISNGAALKLTATLTLGNNVTIAAGQSGSMVLGGTLNETLAGNYSGVAGTLVLDASAVTSSYYGFTAGSATGPAGTVSIIAPAAAVPAQMYLPSPNNNFLGSAKFVLPATGQVFIQCGNTAATSAQFGALDGGNSGTTLNADNKTGFIYLINGVTDGNFAGVIQNGGAAGANNLVKNGAGTQILSGANSYTGTTTVSAGKLVVNGLLSANSAVTVQTNGTLGGIGAVGGTVTVNGTLAPGTNGVGTLTTGAETWNGGGRYICELNSTNASGSGQLILTGGLNVQSSIGSKFTLKLVSLTAGNAPGPLATFSKFANYTWTIATVSGGVSNFATNVFALDTSAFGNDFTGGAFSLARAGNNLLLNYTAAPFVRPVFSSLAGVGTGWMQLGGTGGVGQAYVLLGTTNLTPAVWIPLATNMADINGLFQFRDGQATNFPTRFYRIATP
jgi:autotransporter-associated beta strand protein